MSTGTQNDRRLRHLLKSALWLTALATGLYWATPAAAQHDHDAHDGHQDHQAKATEDHSDPADHADHDDEDKHSDHAGHADEADGLRLTSEQRKRFGIEVRQAGAGSLHNKITLPGEIVFNALVRYHVAQITLEQLTGTPLKTM